MEQQNEKNSPVAKLRIGRFQIAVWSTKVGMARACIQHSKKRKDSDEWVNQSIWCNAEELRDLANILDDINETGQAL